MRLSDGLSWLNSAALVDRVAVVLEHAPVMVWMAGGDGACVLVNRRWLTFRGRTLQQELGRGWADGLHPDDRDVYVASYLDARAVGVPFDAQSRWLRNDGVYRWLQVSGEPLTDHAGLLQGYVGSCVDVTEQRAASGLESGNDAAARCRELERDRDVHVALFTTLIANTSDGVMVESRDGRVLFANEAFCRLFAVERSAQALRGADARVITGRTGSIASRMAQIRRAPASEEEALLEDGRILSIRSTPIAEPGLAGGHLWQYGDVTASRRSEDDLASRQRLRLLAAREESIREAERRRVARLLHDELGQLLTSIKLELSPVMEFFRTARPPSAGDLVDRLQSATGLLDVSTATVQRVCTELRPDDWGTLGIPEALRLEALLFEQRTKIRCRVSISPSQIQTDPERSAALRRIVLESLTNVARHAAAGAVRISLKKTERSIVLSIRDNGRGIARTALQDSRAMGLLGMRERARSVGGDVRIASGGRQGTIVTAVLPLATPNARGARGPATHQ
jgi:PAS domain S-box-containing protein